MRANLSLRVSTDEQAESGAGLEAQEDACRAVAGREGWEVRGVFADEGVSGASGLDKRPALLDAITSLEPGDVLIVAKRDRLGRDPIVVAMIEAAVARQGARVVSAAGEGTDGDGPGDVLMRRMVDAFAEYERLLIKARTKAALGAKKKRGERTGQVPYGWRLEGGTPETYVVEVRGKPRTYTRMAGARVVEDPTEQLGLEWIRTLHLAGRTPREIASALNRAGTLTKNGAREWSPITVKRILNRDRETPSNGQGKTLEGATPRHDRPTHDL